MSFIATNHPRGAGGRFAPTLHGEPGTTLASPATPTRGLDEGQAPSAVQARRLDSSRCVLEEYADLEILDHSPAGRDTVRLGELGDPNLAAGNCWAATAEIIEQVGASEFEAEWLEEITIRRTRLGGQHVAILTGDRDGRYVIDYTARQFQPDLPFPFVAGRRRMESRGGTGLRTAVVNGGLSLPA